MYVKLALENLNSCHYPYTPQALILVDILLFSIIMGLIVTQQVNTLMVNITK